MIDIRDYDQALLHRFQYYYANTFWINKPNFSVSEIRDSQIFEGKEVEFPLVILRRVNVPTYFKDENLFSRYQTGRRLSDEELNLVFSKYELQYTLEVLSFERDNFDELMVELQENLAREPYLSFDNDDPLLKGISTSILIDDVTNNTDIEAMESKTPFHRASVSISIIATIYRKFRAVRAETFYVSGTVIQSYSDTIIYKSEG